LLANPVKPSKSIPFFIQGRRRRATSAIASYPFIQAIRLIRKGENIKYTIKSENKVISGNKINTINAIAKTGNKYLPNTCFRPSKFKYLIRETIKKDRDKTINRNIIGGGSRVYFLCIRIKETNIPAPTVVGSP